MLAIDQLTLALIIVILAAYVGADLIEKIFGRKKDDD